MLKLFLYSFVLVIFLGCSSNNTRILEGVVLGDGPIENVPVCLDTNGNFACDTHEPSTITDSSGAYSLIVPNNTSSALLALPNKESFDHGSQRQLKYHKIFISTLDAPIISIYSTLSYLHMQDQGISNIQQSAASLSQILFNSDMDILKNYTQSNTQQLIDSATYLMRWHGIKLEWLRYGYLDAPEPTTLNSELISALKRQTNDIKEDLSLIANPPPQASLLGDAQNSNNQLYAWSPGMEYGRGFSDVTNTIIQGTQCINANYIPSWYGSQQESYEFVLVESESDLSKNLGISGRLSLNYNLVNGTLDGAFMHTFQSNESSVFLLISYSYQSGTWNVDNATIKPLMLDLFKKNRSEFRKLCGDQFLASATFGGSFLGLLEIKTSSTTEKQNIQASLKGSYSGGGTKVNVSGDFNDALDSITKQYNVSVHIGSRGGDSQQIEVTDLETLKTQAASFITKTQDACKKESTDCFYLASFADYGVIAQNGQEVNATVMLQKQMLPLYDKAVADYEALKPQFDFIHNNGMLFPAQYRGITYLQKTSDNIHLGQTHVETQASKCESTGDCPALETFMSGNLPSNIQETLPSLQFLAVENCAEYALFNHQTISQANVPLYINRDLSKQFTAFCDGNDTYISLQRHAGTNTQFLRYNYFRAQNLDGSDNKQHSIVTMYDKIKIDVQGENLLVDSTNNTYANTQMLHVSDTNLSTLLFKDSQSGNQLVSFVPFGSVFNNQCPSQTTTVTTYTYETQYVYVPQLMTWQEAYNHARANGGELAMTLSSADHLGVVAAYNDANASGAFWIGLKEEKVAPHAHPFQWHNGYSAYDGYSNFASHYPRNFFDPRGKLTSYCFADPSKNFQWDCTYADGAKKPSVMKLNVKQTHTQEIANNIVCDGFTKMGDLDLTGLPFAVDDNNLYFYPSTDTVPTSSVIIGSDNKTINFNNPYMNDNRAWSIQAGDLELIYQP